MKRIILLILLSGCASSTPYGANLKLCVITAQTLAESEDCRCRINTQAGKPCTPNPFLHHDGGTDGAQ